MEKKIYLDLETVGVNQFKANILEMSVLFVENRKIVDEISNNVYYPKKWINTNKQEKIDLGWHNIKSQEDIDKHNETALNFKDLIDVVLVKVKRFGKLGISGWNNAGFDNLILQRHLVSLGIDINEHFDYHTRDIMSRMQLFYEFNLVAGLNLKKCHMDLIETIPAENFHKSYWDCIATKDLDEWIEDNRYKLGGGRK